MVKCPFDDKEYDSEEEMHLHWRDHWDELNSHQKEKVKKAERRKEERKKDKIAKRKKKAGYGLGAAIGLALIAVIGIQVVQYSPAGQTIDVEGLDLDERPVMGERDAEVTMIEFGDYLCPACRSFEFSVKNQLEEDGYFDDGDLNFYYVHLPVIGDRVNSINTAAAAECVAEQDHDEFWEYHSQLFINQDSLTHTQDELIRLAEDNTDIDHEEFAECVDNQDTRDRVDSDANVASEHGLNSTPSVVINGELVRNTDYDAIVDRIESELEDSE